MTITYHEKPQPAPTSCPCLTCGICGPYCASTCLLMEAWEAAGRPGRVEATFIPPDEEQPHE